MKPTGTVTFLFTDIEGSTRLARHHAILQSAVESHCGYVFQLIGDAFCAAFHTAPDALAAALDAQRALVGATLAVAPDGQGQPPRGGDQSALPLQIRARMGIHTGAATVRPDGEYDGYRTRVLLHSLCRVWRRAVGGCRIVPQENAFVPVVLLSSLSVPLGGVYVHSAPRGSPAGCGNRARFERAVAGPGASLAVSACARR